MPLLVYKSLHVLALVYLFAALGAACFHAASGGAKGSGGKVLAVLHGLALAFLLVSGFGMIARLGTGFQGWVWAKMAIWLVLGAAMAFPYSSPKTARLLLLLLPLLGGLAGWLALYKPF
jgi:hypothetical protein